MKILLDMNNSFDESISNFFKNFIENESWVEWMTIFSCFFIFFFVISLMFLFKKENRIIGILMFISLIVGYLLNDLVFKNIFTRDRPFVYFNIEPVGFYIDGYSFPSGHSTIVSSGALTFLFYFIFIEKCKNKTHLAYSIIFSIIAFLVMLSRIALLHHYFTDCLAGLFEGAIISIATILVYKQIIIQKEKKSLHQNEHIDD